MTRKIGIVVLLALHAMLLSIAGCGPQRSLKSVPQELVDQAQVAGMPQVRTWGDHVDEYFIESLARGVRDYQASMAAHRRPLPPTADILAISGGGDEGAYGAGLLCGWTQRGDRPEFRLVTGVSTGALIAPLAFLGPDYDHILRQAYTTVETEDVVKNRGLLAVINRDGIYDTDPLFALIHEWINDQTIQAIAAEHAKGRRLLVATVNLEAQRPVIWDLGAIASSGHPDAAELLRTIMLASASIPGAFEPQYVPVEANGQAYEEMHVDGGTMAQVFLYGAGVDLNTIAQRSGISVPRRPVRLFIIRNARFTPEYQSMQALFAPIAGRAIGTMIKSQGIGDMFRLYVRAQREGMEFNLASIPPQFTATAKALFDPDYMNALFEFGFDQALAGYHWSNTPPYLDTPIESPASPALSSDR